jgi:hypothetical protein
VVVVAERLPEARWLPVEDNEDGEEEEEDFDEDDSGTGSSEAAAGFCGGIRVALQRPLVFAQAQSAPFLEDESTLYPAFLGTPTRPSELPVLDDRRLHDVTKYSFRASRPLKPIRLSEAAIAKLGGSGDAVADSMLAHERDLGEVFHYALTVSGMVRAEVGECATSSHAQRLVEFIAHKWAGVARDGCRLELSAVAPWSSAMDGVGTAKALRGHLSLQELAQAARREAEVSKDRAIVAIAQGSASRTLAARPLSSRRGRRRGGSDWQRQLGKRREGGHGVDGGGGEFFRSRRRDRGGKTFKRQDGARTSAPSSGQTRREGN